MVEHVITEDRINLLKDVTPKLSSKVLAVEAKLTATKSPCLGTYRATYQASFPTGTPQSAS